MDASQPGTDQTSQAAVMTFLEARLAPCRRIDTHAASIFLSKDRAWKLKRAVRFPYLDFTTADRRRTALDAELRLNRRTAPNLYLTVHPIVRQGDTLAIDGSGGETVDWVLEMQRFPDGARLDDHADRNGLPIDLMVRLADAVHKFHDSAEIVLHRPGADDVRSVIDGNRQSLAPFEGLFGTQRIDRLIADQRAACDRHAALLDARARKGKVRRAHGDLHLGNIALVDDEPVLFDCLEFSESLGTIDILYDLGFLLMDLWHRDLHAAANIVFNRYIDLSGEEDGARLMSLFLSLRATVRAHVLAATAERSGAADDKAEAERFVALAESLIRPSPVAEIAIGGLSGTGKTAVARAIGGDFGAAPGARILRSDVLRKRLAGVAPEEHLPEALYSPLASRTVYELLADCAARHLASHTFVIVDAVLAGQDDRARIEGAAVHAHVPFVGCWLEAPVEQRLARVGGRQADASDADVAVVRLQSSQAAHAPAGWRRISAGGSLADTVASAREQIGRMLVTMMNGQSK